MRDGLVDIEQLAIATGVTVRRLREDLREKVFAPERVGPRNKALFSVDRVKAQRAAHRRSIPGEGRPRKEAATPASLAKRIERIAAAVGGAVGGAGSAQPGHAGAAEQPPSPVPGADLGELSPAQILAMVRENDLLPGQVATYRQALEAMRLGREYRIRSGELVEASEVARSFTQALAIARGILEQMPGVITAAVAAAIPLDTAGRLAVQKAAAGVAARTIDALAAAGADRNA